jgi:hypothetical protein
VGRFAAGLDTVRTEANELQRADCAPKASCGDGRITISDWVQAGRYAAFLDTAGATCGPTGPAAEVASHQKVGRSDAEAIPKSGRARAVRIIAASLRGGQRDTVFVELVAEGNENALGFSLNFDPAFLTLMEVQKGRGATGTTLYVNQSQTATGRIGIALALNAGQSFAAGTHELIALVFSVAPVSSSTIAFGDQPVTAEVVDAAAGSLPTIWMSGTIMTSVSDKSGEIPLSFKLDQNSPNPFNPMTTIKYDLPQEVEVELVIHDIMGRHVRTLVNRNQPAGRHEVGWDGCNTRGERVPSGVYLYTIVAGEFKVTRKMAVLK